MLMTCVRKMNTCVEGKYVMWPNVWANLARREIPGLSQCFASLKCAIISSISRRSLDKEECFYVFILRISRYLSYILFVVIALC